MRRRWSGTRRRRGRRPIFVRGVDEGDHRGAGAGEEGAEGAGVARGRDQARQLRVGRRAVRLVEAILREQSRTSRAAGGETRHSDGHASEIRDGVGARHGVGQHAAHLRGLELPLRDPGDDQHVPRRIQPDRLDAIVERDARDQPAEQRRRDVVRMALDLRREPQDGRTGRSVDRRGPMPQRGPRLSPPRSSRARAPAGSGSTSDPPADAARTPRTRARPARPRAPRRSGSIDPPAARRCSRPRPSGRSMPDRRPAPSPRP